MDNIVLIYFYLCIYVCLCVCAWHICVHANQVWLPLNLGLLEEQIFNMVMNNIYKQHYFWLYLTGKINGLAIFFSFLENRR